MPDTDHEIRTLKKQINELSSRLARSHMTGKVVEVENNKIRLELLPPEGGKKFLSPWVRVQEEGGDGKGGYSSYTQAVVGQNMRLMSPSGEISEESLAIQDGPTDDNPSPGEGLKKVMKHGDATFTIADGAITISVGGHTAKFSSAGLTLTGGRIEHEGLNIGSDHTHKDVTPGPSNTGVPNS